jgi:cyanate permease
MVASANRKWLALALLVAVQFMVVLDIAIVNVALPSIQVDLGFSQQNLQWVLSAYALFFGGFLLLGRRATAKSCPHLGYCSASRDRYAAHHCADTYSTRTSNGLWRIALT